MPQRQEIATDNCIATWEAWRKCQPGADRRAAKGRRALPGPL